MAKQLTALSVTGFVFVLSGLSRCALADDLMYGCWTRPACGKVCKLVCETKKLTSVGYGYDCESICIPGASRHGCKHCYTTCCSDSEIKGCSPKIEFCWYDWFACGCAKPRTVKVLTKYQAEKEVCSYHWEVVDACSCAVEEEAVSKTSATLQFPCVYKPAPTEAQLGDVLPLTDEDRAQLAAYLPADDEHSTIRVGGEETSASETGEANLLSSPIEAEPPTEEAPKISLKQRLGSLLGR